MTQIRIFLLLILASLLMVACKKEEDMEDETPTPLEIPSSYDGSAFAANAATELAVTGQLSTLTAAIKEGRDAANPVSASNLSSLYSAGSPSVSDVSTNYYQSLVEGWFTQIQSASGNTYDVANAPSGDGGVLGGYLLEENGLELEQTVGKGLFGAALYNHAVTLMSGEITEATSDRLVAIFGANPSFPNSNNGDKHSNPDAFMATYAARRDPNDGTGYYTTLRDAFIKLQAAAKAGDEYTAERDEALATIQENWEKANAATAINYLYAAISKLNGNPDDETIGSALHSYSEGVGFLHGWKTIDQNYRIITDAQINQILTLINAPAGEEPTSYLLFTDSFNQLPKLEQAISQLQDIYGFTNAQLESFKFNYVNQQDR
jgi:hypothetical protein